MDRANPGIAILTVLLSFLGAFLLFLVQPMLGKVLLPWFGGTPMVWAACMLTFQALLLLGYWYAHRLSQAGARRQARFQIALLLLSLLFLPVLPGLADSPDGETSPLLAVVGVIAASASLPFVMLAATSPLLQRWYVDVYPGRPPWRLYALSNTGSLLALMCYPVLVEPLLDLPRQSLLWSGAYVLYVMGFIYTAWCYRTGNSANASSGPSATVSWRTRARWLLLAATASAMLLVTTNDLSQDVAVLPFLWVMPLALFLVTFILAFDSDRWYRRYPVAMLCLLCVAALQVSDSRAVLDFIRGCTGICHWQETFGFTPGFSSVCCFSCASCATESWREVGPEASS